jgi:hypothetical protein
VLKRRAALREESAREERERNRYKLIEGDDPPPSAKP